MGAMASQITSLTIVYSAVYSVADQRKHQSSASLAFVWGIHRWPVNSPHKWPVTQKMFPFDDVIIEKCCGWKIDSGTFLEFAVFCDLFIGNTCFIKRSKHLIIYPPGRANAQIDCICFYQKPSIWEIASYTVCGYRLAPGPKKKFVPLLRTLWQLKDPGTQSKYSEYHEGFIPGTTVMPSGDGTEETWERWGPVYLISSILN